MEYFPLGDDRVDVGGVTESDLIYFDRRRDADVPEALNRGACALPREHWGCC